MKRSAWTLALLVTLPMTLVAVAPAQAATQISSCPYFITAPGVYQVTQDLGPCPGTAITILASNVNLHLNGHTISGSGDGAGIYVQGAANVGIQNGTVQGFFRGVELQGSVDCKITNVTARQNSEHGIAGFGGTGLTVTGCTATQNGVWGIEVNGSGGNSVSRNSANGNKHGGIASGGGFATTYSNNTANDNGCVGIEFFGANGNTVERNTTDRNGCGGIILNANSHGNIVARNSATANGAGIWIKEGSSQNTVQNNTVSGNFQGILLQNGTAQNTIQGNAVTLNILGIWLEGGATSNTIQGNTALDNRDWDLGDQNSNCDSNAWSSNQFVTDNVAGASDGGPDAGCIR